MNVESIEGDAAITQRKGRVMALFDITVIAMMSHQDQTYKVNFDLCSESCGDAIQVL